VGLRTSISLEEHERRIEKMREYMADHGLDGLCIFGATHIFYLSGFHHQPSERPVALVLSLKGETALMIPLLEEWNVHVRAPHIKEVRVYREYPGLKHPMLHLTELLQEKGLADKSLGVDSDNWGGYGYRGPSLSEVVPKAKLTNVGDVIDDMRMVKSEEELQLIRLSAHFGNVAHSLLQDYVQVGVSELEISLCALADTGAYMVKALGQEWEPSSGKAGPNGSSISLTSGPNTAIDHRKAGGRKVQIGDVLLTYVSIGVGGYVTELERMLIVGPPPERHKRYFDLEVQAQDAALAAIRPGACCGDVEKAVNAFLVGQGLYGLTRSHCGHGVGMETHEAPFFDVGDETVLKPGMVMSVEPCFYIRGWAAFRHSDTVVVTEDGIEMITYYPRDLESLTVHV